METPEEGMEVERQTCNEQLAFNDRILWEWLPGN